LSEKILEKTNVIKKIDKHGMIELCVNMPEHSQNAIRLAEQTPLICGEIRNVIVGGMGGSAIGGEILQNWSMDKVFVPVFICRDYVLPSFADKKTLVFIVSYSGETEETLSVFNDAVRKGCMVVSVTSGGRLLSLSNEHEFPCVVIPKNLPPRMAFPYLFFPLAIVMKKLGIIKNLEEEIEEALNVLEKVTFQNAPTVPTEKNLSKTLALKLCGTVPVVYATQKYEAVARRWKTQFNENSKLPSKYEVFPELAHNEVVGWEKAENLAKTFSIILLREHEETQQIRRKIELTKKFALKELSGLFEIYASGKTLLAKMLSLLCIGDFASLYLAILRGVDPYPVETISKIKAELPKHR